MSTSSKPPAAVAFVQPLLQRASEVEQVEPVIAYYCRLHAVALILETKLHQSNDEVAEYVGRLLGQIEDDKQNNSVLNMPPVRELLNSDDKAKAYVNAFARKIYAKAARDLVEFHVTQKTGQAFFAASTFLSLTQMFGPLDADTAEKIKLAKYHAANILSAVKKGEDPNARYINMEIDVVGDVGDVGKLSEQKDDEHLDDLAPQSPLLPQENAPATEPPQNARSEPIDPRSLGLSNLPDALPAPGSSSPQREHRSRNEINATAPDRAAPASGPVKPASTKPMPGETAIYTKSKLEQVAKQAEATTLAQKHAKYAISALNYDDFKTAEKELLEALEVVRAFGSN